MVMETWTDWFEEDCPFDCVFFDFAKAFDKVPHSKLLQRMASLGVSESIIKWTESYLTGRKQVVVVNGTKSDAIPVSSGVPQGSVIGPTLFVLFINDLPEHAQSSVKMFANDTKMYAPVPDLSACEWIQDDIDSFTGWADSRGMQYHPTKCKVLHFGKDNPNHVYEMDSDEGRVQLQSDTVEENLGIKSDVELSYEQHISGIIEIADQRLGMIKRGFRYLNGEVLCMLYKAMVRPILEGGKVVWKPNSPTLIRALERVQRRATRMVASLRNLPYEDRLRALRLPSLMYRMRRGDMIEVYKRFHGGYDDEFPWLQLDGGDRTRNHGYKLKKIRVQSRQKRKSFSVRVVNDWNSLPPEVVNAPTMNAFKDRLDRHWADHLYEHLD